MNNTSEAGFIKIALGVAVLVIAGLAFYYFTSDVGKTRIDSAGKEYGMWTPANIAKNTDGFFAYCEGNIEKLLNNLKAKEIENNEFRIKTTNTKEKAQNAVTNGTQVFEDLKTAYSKAKADDAFPFTVYKPFEKTYSQESALSTIEDIQIQIEGAKKLISLTDSSLKKADANDRVIRTNRTRCEQQKQEIAQARIDIRLTGITDKLNDTFASIQSVLQTVNKEQFIDIWNLPENKNIEDLEKKLGL